MKLSVRHTMARERSKLIDKVSGGWPKVLSNLKSLLETGAVAIGEPYPKAPGAAWNPRGREQCLDRAPKGETREAMIAVRS